MRGSWSAGFHTGEDYGSPGIEGATAVATKTGIVVHSGFGGQWGAAYGEQVIIESDGTQHLYAHLSVRSVRVGQVVRAGEAVGRVGSTGRSSGPHLHYEERTGSFRYGVDSRPPRFPRSSERESAVAQPRFGAYCYEERGPAHRALQRRLHENGHDPGFGEWPTSLYGEGTKAAVAAFQRSLGWSGTDADGLLGPRTLSELGLPLSWSYRSDRNVYASKMAMRTADSDSVWNVQVALLLRGYSIPDGPTDYFGKQTRRAVRHFQRRESLGGDEPNGIPDLATVKALGLNWVDDLPVGPAGSPLRPRKSGEPGSLAPGATWDPVPGFDGLRPFRSGGAPKVVLHTTESEGKPDWQALGKGIPHFTVDLASKAVWQHLPLDVAAYTLEGGAHSPNSAGGVTIQIEIVGRAKDTERWSRKHYRRLDPLLRWICEQIEATYVFPFPFTGDDGAGVGGSVRQSWERFHGTSGVVGHAHVPYNDHWDPGRLDPDRLVVAGSATEDRDAAQAAEPKRPDERGPTTIDGGKVALISFNVPRRFGKGGELADVSLLSGLMAGCDVIGLQEAGWAESLVSGLGWTVHRPADSTGDRVGQLLAWDPKVWKVLDRGATPLSPETTIQSAAAGPTRHREKWVVWADLRHRGSDAVWNLAVVHFVPSKHLGGAALRLWKTQRDNLIAWIGRQGPRTVVLGDFNAQPQDKVAAPLLRVADVQAAPSHGRRKIDWIVHTRALTAVGKAQALKNRAQSDHKPVRAVLSA